jgi:hypothetical protein
MGESRYTERDGHPVLNKIEDETKLRYKYTRGDYAGEIVEAEICNGHVVYKNEQYSPTGAARAALRDIRGEDYELNGWNWWKYYETETESWEKLSEISPGAI